MIAYDPYTIEERNRQITALYQLRSNGQAESRLPKPKSLLKSLKYPSLLSAAELKALAIKQYKNPVTSLYLRFGAQEVVPKVKAWKRSFDSLKSKALAKHKDFVKTLPKAQYKTLAEDLQEIEAFLSEYLIPTHVRSLIIFKSGEDLNRVLVLRARTSDSLVIDADPYVLPLEELLEENEKVLFVEVSKDETKFTVYHLGYCQDVKRIKSFVPTDTVDAGIPGKAQRHRLTHLQWHLKLSANEAARLYHSSSCQALVLLGENRIAHMLEEYLHDELRGKIIGRVHNAPHAEPRDRKDLIENALRDHKAVREVQAVEELGHHVPGKNLVSGLGGVIASCNLFMVRKLVVNDDLDKKGYVCKEHHYLSLKPGNCPFCQNELFLAENIADELVEISHLHGVDITIVEYRKELLKKYDGVAAVVYSIVTAV
jgi:hypothetical protein